VPGQGGTLEKGFGTNSKLLPPSRTLSPLLRRNFDTLRLKLPSHLSPLFPTTHCTHSLYRSSKPNHECQVQQFPSLLAAYNTSTQKPPTYRRKASCPAPKKPSAHFMLLFFPVRIPHSTCNSPLFKYFHLYLSPFAQLPSGRSTSSSKTSS
jgi:hypothetical protein